MIAIPVWRALTLLFAAAAAAGCGTGGGAAAGATVTLYASAPLHGTGAERGRALCDEARRALAGSGGRAGPLRVRLVCLDDAGRGAPWRLAAIGESARRAAEDSTAVAFLAEPGRPAAFSRPILAAAGIAQLVTVPAGSAPERARPAGAKTPARPAGAETPARPAGAKTPARPAGAESPARPAGAKSTTARLSALTAGAAVQAVLRALRQAAASADLRGAVRAELAGG